MKGAKHTPGPWHYRKRPAGHEVRSENPGGSIAFLYHSTHYGQLNADRIVSCVNGCDAAGVADPGELDVLLAAAWAVNENRTMIPHNPDCCALGSLCVGLRGKANCDSLGCRGGSGYVPKAILISLGDALRRVRGGS